MQWTDSGIILSVRKYGENSAVIRIFSENHGVYGGVARGVHSKANRGILLPGNRVSATWNARLSEQLGAFKCELIEANTAMLMAEYDRLTGLSSACTLIDSALPERHTYPHLYQCFQEFLSSLKNTETWYESYVWLEMNILAECGFGLDLSACAATGTTRNLTYVSPKSARAVSAEAGEPYRDKLLPLPPFLLGIYKNNRVAPSEILDGLHLTGYFLELGLFTPHNRKLPPVRQRLLDMMKEPYGAEA